MHICDTFYMNKLIYIRTSACIRPFKPVVEVVGRASRRVVVFSGAGLAPPCPGTYVAQYVNHNGVVLSQREFGSLRIVGECGWDVRWDIVREEI